MCTGSLRCHSARDMVVLHDVAEVTNGPIIVSV